MMQMLGQHKCDPCIITQLFLSFVVDAVAPYSESQLTFTKMSCAVVMPSLST
jgi:hypothetical protein